MKVRIKTPNNRIATFNLSQKKLKEIILFYLRCPKNLVGFITKDKEDYKFTLYETREHSSEGKILVSPQGGYDE